MTVQKETTSEGPRPRYTYLKDPKNPQRVLTIARRLVKKGENRVTTFEYTFCVNARNIYLNLPDWLKEERTDDCNPGHFGYKKSPGDTFNRKLAHRITNGRFEQGKTFGVIVHDGDRVVPSILKHLSICQNKMVPEVARRIAKAYLDVY